MADVCFAMCQASSNIVEVVIFACPSCGASHFKPDVEVASGLEISCRRCNHQFKVDLNGVHKDESETDAESVDRPIEPPTRISTGSQPIVEADDSDNLDEAFEVLTDAVELPNDAVELAIEPMEIDLDDGVEVSEFKGDNGAGGASDDVPSPIVDEEEHPEDGASQPRHDGYDGVNGSSDHRPVDLSPPVDFPPYADSLDENTKQTALRPVSIVNPERKVRQSNGLSSGEVSFSDTRHAISSQESFTDRRPSSSFSASGTGSAAAVNPARPVFETGKVSLRDLKVIFRRQPTATKVGWVALALALIAGSSSLTYFLSSTGSTQRYLTQTVELRSGPAEGDGYSTVAELEAGIEVTAYDIGDRYTLVRDALGRAGYVQSQSLATTAPKIDAEQKFVACRQAPIDIDLAACQARASAQLDRCQEQCSDPGCSRSCESRFSDCMAGCDTRLVVLDRDAEAEPSESANPLDEAPTSTTPVGSEQGDSSVTETVEAGEAADGPQTDGDDHPVERKKSAVGGRKNARVGKGRKARLRRRAKARGKRRGRRIRARAKGR